MKSQKEKIRSTVQVGVLAALLCVFAPITIPIGPIPVSLTGFFAVLSVVCLGVPLSLASFGIYLAVGILGLPVFSAWQGGFGVLLGPTGGYLAGFLFFIPTFGLCYRKGKIGWTIFGAILGTLLLDAFGTAWFVFVTKSSMLTALSVCVLPFLLPDAVKIFLGIRLGERLRRTVLAN